VDVEFDPAKDARNREKHGVPLLAGLVVIQNRVGEERDDRFAEPRFRTYGLIRDTLFVCVWTPRGEVIRLISVRRASREEREAWLS
jgi:uncharacterized DUF497 family protein